MIEIVRGYALRVQHPTSREMALRSAAAGMIAAESQFRRSEGYQQLSDLARALEQQVGHQPDEHGIPADITGRPYDGTSGGRSPKFEVAAHSR